MRNAPIALGAVLLTVGCATTSQVTNDREVQGGVEVGIGAPTPAPDPRASVGPFHALLSRYGRWVTVEGHGWAWIPDEQLAGPDFFPYLTGGHWVSTSQGWLFLSDLPWGWVTYHYGRWGFDPQNGWYWVPGKNWSPAWVGWRTGGGLVGWAPLPPRLREKVDSVASHFVFVREVDLTGKPVERYLVSRDSVDIARTTELGKAVEHGRVRWYRGPATAKDPSRFEPPSPGVLVRVAVKGKQVTLQERGAIELHHLRQARSTPSGRRKTRLRVRTSAVPAGVRPVMPPMDVQDESRWR